MWKKKNKNKAKQKVKSKVTDFSPWKIPIKVDSSIKGGLASAVEDDGVSNQYFDTIWGDRHILENKSYKMETDARRMKCTQNKKVRQFFFVCLKIYPLPPQKRHGLTVPGGDEH